MEESQAMRIKVQIWLHDLRIGGTEVSLLAELRHMDGSQIEATVVVLGNDLTLRPDFEASGIPVRVIDAGSIWSRARQVIAILRTDKPDVVNTMLFWPNVIVRPFARLLGIPVLTTLVNSDYGPDQRKHSRHGAWAVIASQIADAFTSRFSTRFRAVSDEVAHTMQRRLRLPHSRIMTIHRGRDLVALGRRTSERRTKTRQSLGLDDQVVFLCLGRQDHQKSQDRAVRAFRGLRDSSKGVLLLVGRSGDSTRAIEREVNRAHDPIDVRMLGERNDIGDLLCAADFLLVPSLWEGLPGAVIEAMALETPLILSDIPSSQEASGGNAWFFSSGDVAGCRRLLEESLRKQYPSDLIEACRTRAVEFFDINRTSHELCVLFTQMSQSK